MPIFDKHQSLRRPWVQQAWRPNAPWLHACMCCCVTMVLTGVRVETTRRGGHDGGDGGEAALGIC